MQRPELSVHRRLRAGMVEQAYDMMMTSEVRDDRTGRRHEQDHSGMVARDHAAHEMPWRPPWSRLVVIDAANVELQGRPRHDRNDLVETLDECRCIYQSHGSGICVRNADNNF